MKKRVLIWLPVVAVVLVSGIWAMLAAQAANEREVILEVSGMVCPACPPNVVRALEALEGVVAAEVDLATHQARVRFDASRLGVDDLTEATRRAGYPSRPME